MTDVVSLVSRLADRGETVAVAESLTAGLVMSRFGEVPGASAVLRGGIVAYATDLKVRLLDVPESVVADDGVVSARAAVAMARGVARVCGADWGLATTGVAGPDEQEGKPAATVYVAVANRDRDFCRGPDVGLIRAGDAGVPDRSEIRQAAAAAVLALLDDRLGRVRDEPW